MILAAIKRVVGAVLAARRRARPEPAFGTLKRWSDAANWPGGKPVAGQDLIISGNWLLDEQTPSLGSVTLSGYVRDDPEAPDIALTAANINITATGMLRIGSEDEPRALKATLTLTGAEVGRATRIVPDRTATGGTGNGKLARLAASTGAVAETITVTFNTATTFSVSGSVSGALGTGTVGTVFNNKVRFIATAGSTPWAAGATQTIRMRAQAFTNNGVGRSLQKQPGGRLQLWGRVKVNHTRLAAHMPDNATSATVVDATGWEVGDEIVIGPSDFPDTASGTPVKRTITSIVGNTVSWVGPVSGSRWGLLQYPTDTGLSLTPGVLTKPAGWTDQAWADTPKVLDERAPVLNLTRDIVVQGADDTAWATSKFGAHTMTMGNGADEVWIDSVEFRRVGQAGALARYPVHWHVVSYNMPDGMGLPSDGQLIGLASGQGIRNCSIHTSSQRMITLHGTCGVRVENNVGYDITGHAIFFEEASEMYNQIVDNAIIKVNVPTTANRLTESEAAAGLGNSVAGIWFTNPANTLTGNSVFCSQLGIWNAFATRAFGLTQEVNVNANLTRVFDHSHNIGACNFTRGLITEQPPTDNLGTSNTATYFGGKEENGLRFVFRGNTTWKNMGAGYSNRVLAPGRYVSFTAADNETLDFTGQAGHDVPLESALCVGVSLNNGNNAELRATNTRRACFVSYDEGLVVRDILAYNYTYRPPPTVTRNAYNGQTASFQGSGLVRMGEYIFPVWTFTEYSNWKLINCNPGFMGTPPNIDGMPMAKGSSFTLGILKDVNGLFTGTPGKHVVWNHPFYTYAAANLTDYTHPEAKVTDTVYMGLKPAVVSGVSQTGILTANQYKYLGAFYVDRLDPTGTTVVGSWNIRSSTGAGDGGQNWDWFKHCACANGGVYRVTFDGLLPRGSPGFAVFKLSMMQDSGLMYTLAVAWPGDVPVGMVYQRWSSDEGENTGVTHFELVNTNGTPKRPYAVKLSNVGVTSKADVIADTTGLKYYQDPANNLVWIKVKSDMVWDARGKLATGKLDPNRTVALCIRQNVVS